MNSEQQAQIEEATFHYTIGETDTAIEILQSVTTAAPQCAAAWHALAEVLFSTGDITGARDAGLKALAINEEDVHLHTSLSRIFMELGDKDTAEKHGARARVLGWKATLQGSADE